ncbi:DDE-type integrase/transposase/recombinase [Proteus cibarius]|nr:DDE-type integrase/transposase/recombinase [Proteus terrae subsp. cibarius]MBG2868831.1 DDE-type integrase/transposase/recombinase [Proteus terrae subsp. cibarius]
MNYCENNQISPCRIQSGKPQQNGVVERFNGLLRREFLMWYLFGS